MLYIPTNNKHMALYMVYMFIKHVITCYRTLLHALLDVQACISYRACKRWSGKLPQK